MMQRVASGEYNPARERCIELKGNPASKAFAIRQKALDDLKAENQALLARVSGDDTVPRETYERLVKEGEEREAAHAKRLQRLKEVRRWPLLATADLADFWKQVEGISGGGLLTVGLADPL